MYQDVLPRRGLLGVQVDRELRVERVLGGVAAEIGLAVGDRVTGIDGASVATTAELADVGRRLRAGARVAVRFVRGEETLERSAVAPPYPVEPGVLLGQVISRGARLRTFFALPESDGPFPAVLVLQSIRAESCEAPLDDANPTRALVASLVAAGVAVVRVERSGVGDSEGPSPRATGLETEIDAYRAALAEIRSFDEIDPERVILFGHSFGGMIAPLLARETPVAAACVYGSSARRWHDCVIGTTRRQKDRPAAEMDAWIELLDLIHREHMTPARAFELRPHLRKLRSYECDGDTMYGRHVSLFQELDARDLEAAWRETRARAVFAIHGEHDWICTADESREIAALTNGEFIEIAGAGHELDARVIERIAQTVTCLQPPGKTQP